MYKWSIILQKNVDTIIDLNNQHSLYTNQFKQKIKAEASRDIQLQNSQLQGIIQLLKSLEQDLDCIQKLQVFKTIVQEQIGQTPISSHTENCLSNYRYDTMKNFESIKRKENLQKKKMKRNDSTQNLMKRRKLFKRKQVRI